MCVLDKPSLNSSSAQSLPAALKRAPFLRLFERASQPRSTAGQPVIVRGTSDGASTPPATPPDVDGPVLQARTIGLCAPLGEADRWPTSPKNSSGSRPPAHTHTPRAESGPSSGSGPVISPPAERDPWEAEGSAAAPRSGGRGPTKVKGRRERSPRWDDRRRVGGGGGGTRTLPWGPAGERDREQGGASLQATALGEGRCPWGGRRQLPLPHDLPWSCRAAGTPPPAGQPLGWQGGGRGARAAGCETHPRNGRRCRAWGRLGTGIPRGLASGAEAKVKPAGSCGSSQRPEAGRAEACAGGRATAREGGPRLGRLSGTPRPPLLPTKWDTAVASRRVLPTPKP